MKTRFEAQKLTLVVEMSKVEIWIKERSKSLPVLSVSIAKR